MAKIRKRYSSKQKAKVTLEALQERYTIAELSQKYGVHVNQITRWKQKAVQELERLFDSPEKRKADKDKTTQLVEDLYSQIGRLQVELSWLKKKYEDL